MILEKIRSIAKKIGIKTWYLVTFCYPGDNRLTHMVTAICSISPWLNKDNYLELVDYLKTQTGSSVDPNIISITRFGI